MHCSYVVFYYSILINITGKTSKLQTSVLDLTDAVVAELEEKV